MQILTVTCKLNPTPEDRTALATTVGAYGAACRTVVRETSADLTNEARLRAQVYRTVRTQHGLSANLAQGAIARVAANRKAARATRGVVAEYRDASVQYDERTFRLFDAVASLTLNGGRRRIALALGAHQRTQLARHRGERRIRSAQLVVRRGRRTTNYYRNVQIEVTCAEPIAATDWVGGDMGRTDILHTSTGRAFAGNYSKVVRDRYHRVRRSLQKKASKGTRSSRRRCRAVLQRLSGRERRFHAAENHAIAKRVVQDAAEMRAGICIEDLTGIRMRTRVPAAVRRDHSGWSFHQLRTFLTYKAAIAGVPLLVVDPA